MDGTTLNLDPKSLYTQEQLVPVFQKSKSWFERARWAGEGPKYRAQRPVSGGGRSRVAGRSDQRQHQRRGHEMKKAPVQKHSNESPRQGHDTIIYGVCKKAVDHRVTPKETTFFEFVNTLKSPIMLTDKKHGPAMVPAIFGTPYAINKNVTATTALLLDIEKQPGGSHPMAPEEANQYMQESGLCFCLWTTHSHTPETPRYRVLFPLDGVLAPEHIKRVYGLLVASLGPFSNVVDASCFHPARLFFLPSVHPGRVPYYQWFANAHGKRLKAARLTEGAKIVEAREQEKEEAARQRYVAHESLDRRASLIEQFNASHRVEELLDQAGYVRKGKKWLCPNSHSGIAGVIVFHDDNVVFSHHHDDPLSDNHTHDPFSIYCLLWHNGDAKAACAAIRQRRAS